MNRHRLGQSLWQNLVTSVPRWCRVTAKAGAFLAQVSLPSCLESIIRPMTVTETTLGGTSGLGPGCLPSYILHRFEAGMCNQGRLLGGGGTWAGPGLVCG